MLQKQFDTHLIAQLMEIKHDFVVQLQKELVQEAKILARLKRKQKISTIAKALKVSEILVEVLKDTLNKKDSLE